ncbi:glycosyltransferase [Microbacterium sp. NPDC056234]|uniref:glycosyltransferase n=1 Tax=Microbacterium sp. NPDC056234 TaxID=3345757 RepID=UPI0035E084BF
MGADVDVIVAVHDPARPVERAVASALESEAVARVIVVCHNIPIDPIRSRLGSLADDPRIVIDALDDGTRSPAGPFNRGLDLALGAFVSVMGSDDAVQPGAIDAWRRAAAQHAADVVIAPLRHAGGSRVPTPPTLRRSSLRGARDRLAFRTAPLGLVSRAKFGDLRFTEGLATGEDLAYSTRLWFSGARIAGCRESAYYLIHDDNERVTFTKRTLAEDVRAVELLIRDPWVLSLSARDRRAIGVKLWRVNLFGAVHYRAGAWSADDRSTASAMAAALAEFSPQSTEVLSRAEGLLADALRDPTSTDSRIDLLSQRRRRFASLRALVPIRTWRLFDRDAPLRFSAATWWALRG